MLPCGAAVRPALPVPTIWMLPVPAIWMLPVPATWTLPAACHTCRRLSTCASSCGPHCRPADLVAVAEYNNFVLLHCCRETHTANRLTMHSRHGVNTHKPALQSQEWETVWHYRTEMAGSGARVSNEN